jgi:hypothetical protein
MMKLVTRRRLTMLGGLSALVGLLSGRLARAYPSGNLIEVPRKPSSDIIPASLYARSDDTVSVTQFGAIGNGANDDTLSIQAALNAAGATVNGIYGGDVLVPKGNFMISSTLTVPNGVHLRGISAQCSQITATNAFNQPTGAMITNSNHAGQQEYAYISNLYVNANKGGGAVMAYAVDLTSVFVNSFIKDCIIGYSPGVGLHLASAAACGPIFVMNNWVLASSHQNIFVEELAGNSGAFCNLNFYGNTSEHCASGYANVHLRGIGSLFGVSFSAHHIEQANSGTGTYCFEADGLSNLVVDNLDILAAGGTLTGVYITNSGYNARHHYRGISNINLVNPILIDSAFGASFAGVNVPWYSTPDSTYVIGSVVPAKNNAYTCGASVAGWSGVYGPTLMTSDARLKQNVDALDYGLDALLRLVPIAFDWKDGNGERQIGLVAQAVQDVIPEAVIRGDDPEGLLALNYTRLTPIIIKAIQELHAKVT